MLDPDDDDNDDMCVRVVRLRLRHYFCRATFVRPKLVCVCVQFTYLLFYAQNYILHQSSFLIVTHFDCGCSPIGALCFCFSHLSQPFSASPAGPIGASIVAMSPSYMLDRNPALMMGKPSFESRGPPIVSKECKGDTSQKSIL